MQEHTGLVTIQGNPLTLLGKRVKVGETAPEFEALDNDLNPVKFSEFKGKVIIISSVPSLDTPVCSIQTQRFNSEAEKLGSEVQILTISMDLPFAQKRWCAAEGVSNLKTLSDHRDAAFGAAYGLLIKELRLLGRAVLVVDKDGVIKYEQLVHEVTDEPDYDAALEAVKGLL